MSTLLTTLIVIASIVGYLLVGAAAYGYLSALDGAYDGKPKTKFDDMDHTPLPFIGALLWPVAIILVPTIRLAGRAARHTFALTMTATGKVPPAPPQPSPKPIAVLQPGVTVGALAAVEHRIARLEEHCKVQDGYRT